MRLGSIMGRLLRGADHSLAPPSGATPDQSRCLRERAPGSTRVPVVPVIGSGLIGGSLAMARVMAGDVARSMDVLGLMNGDAPEDWLDARDPYYIREALPALRAWSDVYFRAEVEGLERIPADEPVLLVGNHSGGT